jgi:hypothetical protein
MIASWQFIGQGVFRQRGANFHLFLGVEKEAVGKRVTKHTCHAQLKVK